MLDGIARRQTSTQRLAWVLARMLPFGERASLNYPFVAHAAVGASKVADRAASKSATNPRTCWRQQFLPPRS
jgi:hypothetical protein